MAHSLALTSLIDPYRTAVLPLHLHAHYVNYGRTASQQTIQSLTCKRTSLRSTLPARDRGETTSRRASTPRSARCSPSRPPRSCPDPANHPRSEIYRPVSISGRTSWWMALIRFIRLRSRLRPPSSAKVWPSIDVPPPKATTGNAAS